MTCWPAIKKNVNGVVFVYSPSDTNGARKLDLYYNYFVNQQGFSPRQCIVFANHIDNEENDVQPNVKLCKLSLLLLFFIDSTMVC